MSMPILISTAIALALSSAPAKERYMPTKVEVDVDPLVEQSPAEDTQFERTTSDRTGREVLGGVREALKQRGVPLDGEGPLMTVAVRLEWKVYLASHYRVRITVSGPDGVEETVTLECVSCDEPKLAATIAERVAELLPLLEVEETASSDPSAVVVAKDPPHTSEVVPEGENEGEIEVKRIGPMGWAGVGTGVGGVVGLALGAVYLRRGTEQSLTNDVLYEWDDNYRPMGGALAGVGGVLLLTGAVLIVVDQTVYAKRRARRADHARLRASYVPHGGGFVLIGRF